ncbi:hypothetical protein BaOVIS_026430 [Babesia ovis]|uniref:Uncharacterized protein n=1 Tax=Babesia ovis TaxID=5869 RepID=A0A9W5TEW9_BABOV|nr:hypothetical protein BaOVIS_026430 [Babesia ovis]
MTYYNRASKALERRVNVRTAEQRPLPKLGISCQRRYVAVAAEQSINVWKMPWQQSSIFDDHGNINAGKKKRDTNSGATPCSDSDAKCILKNEPKVFVHEIFKTRRLPKWNANIYVRALQNAAYIGTGTSQISQYEDILKQLVKSVAQNITSVNNYELTRVVFACSKGKFLQRGLVTSGFIKLVENEVMQRLETLYTIDLFRVLHSITSINAEGYYPVVSARGCTDRKGVPFDVNMVKCVAYRIVDRIANLGVMDIANFVCILAYNGIKDSNMISKINRAVKRRLWGVTEVNKILTPAIALGMFGSLGSQTADSAIKALRRYSVLPKYAVESVENKGNRDIIRKTNGQIFPLKLLEIILRLDYPEVYQELDPDNRLFLMNIRQLMPLLVSPGDWDYLRTWSRYNFVPYIHGPYVMKACDPVRKIILEPEIDWLNVSSWQMFYLQHYQNMRLRHLQKSGFEILNNICQ